MAKRTHSKEVQRALQETRREMMKAKKWEQYSGFAPPEIKIKITNYAAKLIKKYEKENQ